jgi:hypothetical protein
MLPSLKASNPKNKSPNNFQMPLINHANVRAVAFRYFEACLLFDACDAGSAVVSAGWERPSLYHIVSKEIIMIVGTEKE